MYSTRLMVRQTTAVLSILLYLHLNGIFWRCLLNIHSFILGEDLPWSCIEHITNLMHLGLNWTPEDKENIQLQKCMNFNSGFCSYSSLRVRIPSGVRNANLKQSCIAVRTAKLCKLTTKNRWTSTIPGRVCETDVLNVIGRQTEETKAHNWAPLWLDVRLQDRALSVSQGCP
jgi:hypothetical protein